MNRRPFAQLALLLVFMLHAACDEGDPIEASYASICVSECEDRECGDDGCGGSCGTCKGCGYECQWGTCEFSACDDLECGDDGCGGSCGQCTQWPRSACTGGLCTCSPSCTEMACGDDGCGGVCQAGCGLDEFCNHLFMCEKTSVGKPCPSWTMEDCSSDADGCVHHETDGWSVCTVLCTSNLECPDFLGPGSCCGEVKGGSHYCLPSESATCSP